MAVITLSTYKTWAGISDTDDDDWLQTAVDAVAAAVEREVGSDLGSSADTTRTYDGSNATDGGRRLRIPGGIRAFTAVEVSNDASTWTAVTDDVRLGPPTWEKPSERPYSYIESKPDKSVCLGSYVYVRVTGTTNITFGWAAWPDEVVQDALVAVQRMMLERGQQGQYPNETSAVRYLNKRMLATYRGIYRQPDIR